MSHYGTKTFPQLFSVHKKKLAANEQFRFGGSHYQLAYACDDLSPVDVIDDQSGVNIINTTTDTVSVVLMGLQTNTASPFSNVSLVDVTDTYTVANNMYGVVLEGSVTHNDTVLDANTDIHALLPDSHITGVGKLIVFEITL